MHVTYESSDKLQAGANVLESIYLLYAHNVVLYQILFVHTDITSLELFHQSIFVSLSSALCTASLASIAARPAKK